MHDGRTRKVNAPMPAMRAEFLESHRASLTVLRGPAAGTSRLACDGVAERARGAGAHVALGLELFDGLVAERIRQAGQRGAKIVP